MEQRSYSVDKLTGFKMITKHLGCQENIGTTPSCFEIKNKKREYLGYIFYRKDWKEYVWVQENNIVMSEECLKELLKIINLIKYNMKR